MAEDTKHHPAQPGGESFLLGRWRPVHGLALGLLWSPAGTGLVYVHSPRYIGLVCGSHEL